MNLGFNQLFQLASNQGTKQISSYLNEFAKAVKALLNADLNGFIDHLVLSLKGIGAFLILLGVLLFASKKTVFRDPKHHKYAVVFSIGVTLIALAEGSIFNWLLVLSGPVLSFILVAIIIAFIWEGIATWRHGHAAAAEASAELNSALRQAKEAEKEKIGAEIELSKMKSQLSAEEEVEKQEERMISNARRELDRIRTSTRNIIERLIKIAEVLRRVANIRDLEHQRQAKEQILRELQAITSTLAQEAKPSTHLHEYLERINQWLASEFSTSNPRQIKQRVSALVGYESANQNRDVERLLKQITTKIQNTRKKILDLQLRAKKTIEKLDNSYYQFHNELQTLINALGSGNFSGATRSIETAIRIKKDELRLLDEERATLQSEIAQIENEEGAIENLKREIQDIIGRQGS